jgi:hypothetical protein
MTHAGHFLEVDLEHLVCPNVNHAESTGDQRQSFQVFAFDELDLEPYLWRIVSLSGPNWGDIWAKSAM